LRGGRGAERKRKPDQQQTHADSLPASPQSSLMHVKPEAAGRPNVACMERKPRALE
jgi:hypothetical protein